MKLIINGKYIEISEYVELIEENPIINNFDTQFSAYSNTFEIPYSGEIADVLDISALRKTTSPYILIDCHVVDGVLLIPAKLIVMSFDVQKNTIKVAISGKIEGGKGTDGFDIRKTKLTDLRHKLKLNGSVVFGKFTDEVILRNKTLDLTLLSDIYFNETEVLSDNQDYPHEINPNKFAILMDIQKFCTFINQRYGIEIQGCPNVNVFSNQNKARKGDLLSYNQFSHIISSTGNKSYSPTLLSRYPAGVGSDVRLTFGDGESKNVNYINNIPNYQNDSHLIARLRFEHQVNISDFDVHFKGNLLGKNYDPNDNKNILFGVFGESVNFLSTASENDKIVDFQIINRGSEDFYEFLSYSMKFYVEIEDNEELYSENNTRQLFQNLPDITVLDFLKQIAKASAKYIEISENTITFKNISESLSPTSIIDATDYFIKTSKVDFSLYDSESLEYWYKEAEQPTLVIPISDETVKNPAKKIDIDILLTNDNNVQLFKDDGITPREGMATYPFLDITNEAADLQNFYLAIQKPQVITATFHNFEVKKNQSILVRQLNGVFIPTKTIRTNKNIIELELLKIEE